MTKCKLKKLCTLLLSIGIILSLSCVSYGKEYTLPRSEVLDDLLGMSAKLYNAEENMVGLSDGYQWAFDNSTLLPATPSDAFESTLFIAQGDITIKHNGMSAFVDAIWYNGDEYINISNIADWSSDDQNVVIADQGSLLATGIGTATVTVTFKEKSFDISVVVEEYVDLMELANSCKDSVQLVNTDERDAILERALEMINVTWTPSKSMKGWMAKKNYEPDNLYTGIPYSQTEYQTNYRTFLSKVSASDFCDDYTRTLSGETKIMPKYGNDCSAFVSFCWNISRNTTSSFISGIKNGTFNKVGEYSPTNPTQSSLLASYPLLQPGDAIVKAGHAILIYISDSASETFYCYEQTPYNAQIKVRSYSECAAAGYMPFTNFSSGWRIENGETYYYQNGEPVTGWYEINDEWYYFGGNGAMKTGWYQEGETRYYLHADGKMAHSEWIQDSDTNYWYYFHGSGNMAFNEWIPKDDEWHYLKSSGQMATSEWVDWTDEDGYWYWVQADGAMMKNGSLTINGVVYQFDESGRCLNP